MADLLEAVELRRQCELQGIETTKRLLNEAIRDRHIRPEDFSIRDLFEGLVEGGEQIARAWENPKRRNSTVLQEASNAVDTSAFSSITGQIIYNKVLEGYENPAFLWPDLFDNLDTVFLDGERLPEIGGAGDVAEVVDEGQPYPTVGLNEGYVDFGPIMTRGFIIPVTRRIIVADRTGLLLQRASESGYHYLGVNMEKRALDVALTNVSVGQYKRNGTSTNTFLTSGGYINDQTGNALVSWRSLESQELLFDAITDPNTGEPMIVAGEMTMVVPTALKMTGLRILDVTDIGQVDNQVAASTVRQYGPNPIKNGKMVNATGVKMLSSAYVKSRTNSATKWFYGQPKRALLKRTAWNVEPTQAASNSEAEFTSDIWQRYKVSEASMFGIQNPRYWSRSDQ